MINAGMITEATSLPQGVSTDSFSKLINEIMFHPSLELFTGCPSKHVLRISCKHSVTPSSLIQTLFICLIFSMSTLHQDSSTPPLTQQLFAFPTWRPKHLDIAHFPMPLLLSGILCLVKLDILNQPAFKTALKAHLYKSYLCWLNL